jgi:pimeloyl-ACP methyl ester carboxylesterase
MSRSTPGLDALQDALAAGDVASARRALLSLSGRELELFREEIGDEAAERAVRSAARGRRRAKLGRVIVLPGIMGSELDAVDRSGDADRIWLNFLRLIAGRIDDLELGDDGSAAKPGVHVRTAGVHRKTYVPLLMELDTSWHVRPFAYDWREDIDKSAARLDGEIHAFGGGEPVHLVAHSMGGLVSRRFVQLHAATWRAMDDSSGRGQGGRLVMLGTPNRGSFAIPLTLTGTEKVVQTLAKADLRHDLGELLAILSSFPGLYQMMPSPRVSLGDDHAKLFEAASWGEIPVRKPLLARGQAFLRELHDVVDPQRLLYVAGVNQPTPAKIRIDAPGRFSFRETLDGDGRVPHELGLLEGVATYWVDEIHGDLAKSGPVLDAITELLSDGETNVLSRTKPAKPPSRAVSRGWRPAEELEPVPPAIDTILADAGRRRNGAPALTSEEEVRLENLVFAEYLGSGGTREAVSDRQEMVRAAPPAGPAAPATERRPIAVEVVWGDVTKVEGDVYCVGHYEGVLPQRGELALDRVVSGIAPDEAEPDRRRLVVNQHMRRGILRGALGDVAFFPWGGPEGKGRIVAIAGMGRPGTFDPADLRRLVRGLILAVSGLPQARTICTVLIGSGEGTLTIQQAIRGFIEGIEDAVDEIAASEDDVFTAPVERLVVVELDRGRAAEILETFRSELRRRRGADRRLEGLELRPRIRRGEGGTLSVEQSLALLVDSALAGAAGPSGSRESRALETLVESMPGNQAIRKLALEQLRSEGGLESKPGRLTRFRVERRAVETRRADIPVRVSFWEDGRAIRAAAIHQAATVPERLVTVGGDLIDELILRMTDPPAEAVDDLSSLLYRLLVPAEFREVLMSGPFVFEIDRSMARIQWELLAGTTQENGVPKPLAVQTRLARQLRTTYSPPPLPPNRPSGFRALVVGDPGDPQQGDDLPGARNEALRVKELLEAHDEIVVDARIGAPSVPREGRLRGVEPADRLEVLSLLLRGGYDLVNYAGHGDFDPEQPNRVGWLFAGGLLTPGEIGRLDRVPAIIVSNACLSARTSLALEGNRRADVARSEAGLLPSLADEFFHLGVRNYVGTAWEVNDVGAELFAETFYDRLLAREPFGEAVRTAREALWKERDVYGALWAAYQHYGDPTTEAVLT